MKTIAGMIIALTIATTAHAWEFAEGWGASDTTLSLVSAGLQFVDYRQTSEMVDHPDRYQEVNGILDEHPTQADVDVFFLVMMVARPLVAALLPPEIEIWGRTIHPRTIFLGVSVGASAGTVIRNNNVIEEY